jgi:hypothetical protein
MINNFLVILVIPRFTRACLMGKWHHAPDHREAGEGPGDRHQGHQAHPEEGDPEPDH